MSVIRRLNLMCHWDIQGKKWWKTRLYRSVWALGKDFENLGHVDSKSQEVEHVMAEKKQLSLQIWPQRSTQTVEWKSAERNTSDAQRKRRSQQREGGFTMVKYHRGFMGDESSNMAFTLWYGDVLTLLSWWAQELKWGKGENENIRAIGLVYKRRNQGTRDFYWG